jgi:hypothetical protein
VVKKRRKILPWSKKEERGQYKRERGYYIQGRSILKW